MHDSGSLFKSFESFTLGQEKGLLKMHPLQLYRRLALTIMPFTLYILPGLSFLLIVHQLIVACTLVA